MISNITQQSLKATEERFFFILGTSRSGSTLLQSMVNSHSKMVIPPETHFFHSARNLIRQFGRASDKERFAEKLLSFWYDEKTRIRDLGLSGGDVQRAAKQLSISHPVDLFTLQLTMYRMLRQKEIVGEKTPRHILHVPEILKAYPKAKIISMFRDPRATAYSEIKAHFGSPSVIVTTKRWKRYVQMHEKLSRELPKAQYMMLRYQELIDDPKRTLQEVCDFLEVDFEPAMLEYYNRDEKGFAAGEQSWKKGTLKPIQKGKNTEWKKELSPWQVSLVEQTAGEQLNTLDYAKLGEGLSFPKNRYYWCLDYSKSIWATLSGAREEGYTEPTKLTFK